MFKQCLPVRRSISFGETSDAAWIRDRDTEGRHGAELEETQVLFGRNENIRGAARVRRSGGTVQQAMDPVV